ncbi:MAG: TlpA disulfide reductase family protein [Acidobacteriota bacterium]
MKEFISYTALFILLAFVFSGCGGAVEENRSTAENPAQPVNAGSADAPKKASVYPPLNAAVAQADIKNLDGTTFKVADKKGKVLLLNMWATWCGPCRSEMPALVRMQDAHRDSNFEVIGLNTDDEPAEQINSFAAEMKLNYPLVWADTALQSSLLKISKFGGIPQSFLIDRDGNLRAVFQGANASEVRKMEDVVAKVTSE